MLLSPVDNINTLPQQTIVQRIRKNLKQNSFNYHFFKLTLPNPTFLVGIGNDIDGFCLSSFSLKINFNHTSNYRLITSDNITSSWIGSQFVFQVVVFFQCRAVHFVQPQIHYNHEPRLFWDFTSVQKKCLSVGRSVAPSAICYGD